MRGTGLFVITSLCLAATAAGQSKAAPRRDVVLRGCVQAEPQPASASGKPVLILTNASVGPNGSSGVKEPSLGKTIILHGGTADLSNYIGQVIEVRASIAQGSHAPKAVGTIGTSGSNNPPGVESDDWPRARVKAIRSVGDCEK
jgi:hypothetical protein